VAACQVAASARAMRAGPGEPLAALFITVAVINPACSRWRCWHRHQRSMRACGKNTYRLV
jgi:hypothetical protein